MAGRNEAGVFTPLAGRPRGDVHLRGRSRSEGASWAGNSGREPVRRVHGAHRPREPERPAQVSLGRSRELPPLLVETGNSAFYDNDEMYRVLLKAKAATKTEERDQLYKNACQIFQRDVPWFTIAHTQIVIPRRREVMNFNPYASYTRNLKNVWVKS